MPMTPLAALIVECQRSFEQQHRMPLTFGDIARRSHDALTRGRVQQLATGPVKALPSPATLRGLALGIGAPYSSVLQRALESAGYLTAPLEYQEDDRAPMTVQAADDRARARLATAQEQRVATSDQIVTSTPVCQPQGSDSRD